MQTSLNNNKTIPISERPKLYDQMLAKPYELNELDPKELFIYLEGVKRKDKLSFKYYSEFLNMVNTIIFYYLICHYNFESNQMNSIIFFTVDSLSIIVCFIGYFLNRNKFNFKRKINLIISCVTGIIASWILIKFSSSDLKNYYLIHKYYKLNFILFSLMLLISYDNYTSPNFSSSFTRTFYISLAVILSTQTSYLEQRIRIFIYSFEFFEFIPELRKFINSYSSTHNVICYLLTLIWYTSLLLSLNKVNYVIRMITWNILIIRFYPLIFQYYYDNYVILIRGLWDLPDVISYT